MSQKRYKPEEIIGKLRDAEVLLSQGTTVDEICRKIEVNKQTYCRWRQEYGGLRVDQAHWMKELEKEKSRLKRLVAGLSLDNQMVLPSPTVSGHAATPLSVLPLPTVGGLHVTPCHDMR